MQTKWQGTIIPKYLVIYKTKKNEIKEHLIDFPLNRQIGEITGNGWEVIDIQVFYNSRFISLEEYERLNNKTKEKNKMKQKNEEKRKMKNSIFHLKREVKQWKNKHFKR